jgi:hypothetical protein
MDHLTHLHQTGVERKMLAAIQAHNIGIALWDTPRRDGRYRPRQMTMTAAEQKIEEVVDHTTRWFPAFTSLYSRRCAFDHGQGGYVPLFMFQ